MKVFTAVALSLCALAVVVRGTPCQALPPGAQQALQNPDAIRQRIRESGLSADQIRARLRASGYPENLLDSYLGGGAPPAALSPGRPNSPPSKRWLRSSGVEPANAGYGDDPVAGDTLVSKSNVFGVDVFRRSTTQFLPLLAGPVPPDYHLGRVTCSS